MPEGPEVRTIVDELNRHLKNFSLIGVKIDVKSRFYTGFPGSNLFSFPLKLKKVSCKGKQIFFHLLAIDGNIIYLNSTLGTMGKWVYKPENHSDMMLVWESKDLINRVAIYFDDQRHQGYLSLFTEDQYQNKLNKLGPDLLTENVSWELWYKCMTKNTRCNQQICKVLMNQAIVSGIGNYLKAEILYYAKIRPNRLVGDLSNDELNLIRLYSMKLIRESYQCGGLTIKTYWDPNGKRGTFTTLVYNKLTDNYQNPVIKSKFADNRTTQWCPNVQH